MAPPTIAQRIAEDSECINNWYAANPQFEPVEHPESEPKIFIPKAMVESPAYRSLSANAMLVLQDLMCRREMRYVGRRQQADGTKKKAWAAVNNGQIKYAYSIAELKKPLTRQKFTRAIDDLQAKGFIDITHIGRGGRKPATGEGDSTMYYLDTRWEDFAEATQKAVKPPRNPRKKDTRRDRGFQQYWQGVKLLATIAYYDARCRQILSMKSHTG